MQKSVGRAQVLGEAVGCVEYVIECVANRVLEVFDLLVERIDAFCGAYHRTLSRLRGSALQSCAVPRMAPDCEKTHENDDGCRPLTPALKKVWDILGSTPKTAKEIARTLGLARGNDGAVRQRLRQVRKRGYAIGHTPGLGYFREVARG